jgi:hypothetical protein
VVRAEQLEIDLGVQGILDLLGEHGRDSAFG